VATYDFPFLGKEKLIAPLIAIPYVDSAKERHKESKNDY
jgi:inner membrane protein involved in colicin E2 resistance